MFDFSHLLIFGMLGSVMGACLGLLGIGGALLINPFCWYLFQHAGVQDPIPVTSATMSFAIVFNATLAARRHHKQKNILWDWTPFIVIGALLGSFVGPRCIDMVERETLRRAIGLLQVGMSFYIFWKINQKALPEHPSKFPKPLLLFFGFLTGFISSLAGIGGGAITVPLLFVVCGLPMKNAVGISTFVMMFSTGSGSLNWMWKGWAVQGIPSPHLGYVFWPASIAMALPGMVVAWKSAGWVHKINQRILQHTIAILLAVSGLNLLFGLVDMFRSFIG